MLARGDVPMERVTVFVADDEEALDYTNEVTALPYDQQPGKIVALGYDPRRAGSLEDGPYAVGAARNLIVRSYPRGTRLVQIDDDLRGLVMWTGQRDAINCASEPLSSIALVIEAGFEAARIEGVDLWGIHPARTYMRNEVKAGLYYIGAAMFGHVVRGDDTELVTLDDKEDYERSIRFFIRDGAVVRLDWCSWLTTGYGGAGGMQETRTDERILASAQWLADRYPDLASLNLKKRSGKPEVRLKRFG
jgi:hypothetical protein